MISGLQYVGVPNMFQNAPVLLAVCCQGLGDKLTVHRNNLMFVVLLRKEPVNIVILKNKL